MQIPVPEVYLFSQLLKAKLIITIEVIINLHFNSLRLFFLNWLCFVKH